MAPIHERWPPLPLSSWAETCDTLHLWTQVVGKLKLVRCPFLNEWWQVALTLTTRGMTTGTMPDGDRSFAVDFDFVDHRLLITTSDGRYRALPLGPCSVADFYRSLLTELEALGIEVRIPTTPSEIPDPIPFERDRIHSAYDPEPVQRWWRIQLQVEQILQRFRSSFVGKSSPVQFFWGSFDLSATRFSGRTAPPPEGAPRFVQLAEDQENYACGFWPGNANMAGVILGEPGFYAYLYPEPPGFREERVAPGGWDPDLGEFILRYEEMRTAADPDQTLLDFYQRTYRAGASRAGWDRSALERNI